MEKTTIQIEFYSDFLENDITLDLLVNYESVDDSYISGAKGGLFGSEPIYTDYNSVQFLNKDVKILTKIPHMASLEFLKEFDNYVEEIREAIENEINN